MGEVGFIKTEVQDHQGWWQMSKDKCTLSAHIKFLCFLPPEISERLCVMLIIEHMEFSSFLSRIRSLLHAASSSRPIDYCVSQ